MNIVLLLGGLLLLFVAGELLVSGSVKIAYRFKISKLVVGLTVVSLGTSAPELFVSIMAAMKGHPDIAVGNVLGSNIANIGLVIALTVLFFPIAINRKIRQVDYPVMLTASLIFFLLFLSGFINKMGGIALLVILSLYLFSIIRKSRIETTANNEVIIIPKKQFYYGILSVVVGMVGLYYGSGWFLEGATGIAKYHGLSDHVIGVTVVAFGTSVPELATSFMAAYRKHGDIAVGNILGSNVFNIHAVIGTTAIFKDITFSESLSTDIYWMLGFAFFLIPAFYLKKKLNWPAGVVLLAGYILYIYVSFSR